MNQSNSPRLTGALALALLEKSKVQKPTARGTNMRYSSSFGCGRQMGYAAIGAEITEPMDVAGAWATGLGTIIHELTQAEIAKRYPSAQFEVSSQTDDISGSCDALISIHDIGSNFGGTHVLWELKTMGLYNFDKQVGWNRARSTHTNNGPAGPSLKAIAQAGMNALGIEREDPEVRIETIIMGAIAFEALSKNKAAKMFVGDDLNRFIAEFEVPREEWEPLALDELGRMKEYSKVIVSGFLPPRVARDDDGELKELNPLGNDWMCSYCAYRTTCLDDGAGIIKIEGVE